MKKVRVGINPQTKERHEVVYGWDETCGFYFRVLDINDDLIVNKGYIIPITEQQLTALKTEWSVI